ncbi:MAG: NADH-quinone oxidoreductase subunit L [Chloroflexi bacterium]|nr:NADH-quinone oxidoreductase subunit L [Chloroflexota bacterium]
MSNNAWLIAALPLGAFALIALGARRSPALSAWLTILAIGLGGALSLQVLREIAAGARIEQSMEWLPLGHGLGLTVGFQVDPLTAIMLVVVTSVSLLVQIYSLGYMHGDNGYSRYYAAMSLFTFSMLGLVLANSLLTMYIFWELVGLCSYLLIGHWHERPEASAAAKKAFIVTRLGDFGFLLGILFLYWHAGTLEFRGLEEAAAAGRIPAAALTVGMLLVFCGAVGKSAQFPLHVWLPDAMEGPTPVSALIHAATMVVAGVYLMARTFPLLEHSATAMMVVAVVGGFTAIFAASMGIVANDIKRVLAYSTVSQLGYMIMAIGLGAMSAGMFHLFNHAFFKALLFLCAGSLIHLMDTNDLSAMGGLRRQRPITFIATTIAALSLAGIFPLSGFWSKDEILAAAASTNPLLFAAALATVFLTATYMFRLIFLAFLGNPRGQTHDHPEPLSMTIPLLVLIVPSVASGLLGTALFGNPFGSFLEGRAVTAEVNLPVAGISTAVALAGILLAWVLYGDGRVEASARLAARFQPVHTLLVNRYYMDHLYNGFVARIVLGFGWLSNRIDLSLIDAFVNGIGSTTISAATSMRRMQSGQLQAYAWAFFAGTVALAVVAALPLLMGTR